MEKHVFMNRWIVFIAVALVFGVGITPCAFAEQSLGSGSIKVGTKAWLKQLCIGEGKKSVAETDQQACSAYIQGVLDGFRDGWDTGVAIAVSVAPKNDYKGILEKTEPHRPSNWFCIPAGVKNDQIVKAVKHYLRHPLMGIDAPRDLPTYVMDAVASRWPCANLHPQEKK